MYILLDSVFLIFICCIEFFSVRCVRGTAYFIMLFVRAIFYYRDNALCSVWDIAGCAFVQVNCYREFFFDSF